MESIASLLMVSHTMHDALDTLTVLVICSFLPLKASTCNIDESGKVGKGGAEYLFPATLLLRLDYLLDDLGLLYQECSKDPWDRVENVGVTVKRSGPTLSSHNLHISNHRTPSVRSSLSWR